MSHFFWFQVCCINDAGWVQKYTMLHKTPEYTSVSLQPDVKPPEYSKNSVFKLVLTWS